MFRPDVCFPLFVRKTPWGIYMEGKLVLLAMATIILAGFIGAWEFRYSEEYHEYGRVGKLHRNRITGVRIWRDATDDRTRDQPARKSGTKSASLVRAQRP
jgi:hypothetical protein